MKNTIKSAAVGFAVGLAFAGVAVQAAQHDHTVTSPPKEAPATSTQPMQMMMADPATRQKMMEQMAQCRDMMSMMIERMGNQGQMPMQPPAPPK